MATQINTLRAIQNRFASDANLTAAFPQGLWFDEFPDQLDTEDNLPYAGLVDNGGQIDPTSETAYVERRGITLFVFNVGANATLDKADIVRKAMDITNQQANGVLWLKFELTTDKTIGTAHKTDTGKKVYVTQLDYEIERMGNRSDW